MSKLYSVIILLLLLFYQNTARVLANHILFSDNFSNNSFYNWQQLRGNFSLWELKEGHAIAKILTPATVTELIPTDLQWNNEWKNIEYSVNIKPIQGVDKNISFSIRDIDNWFEIHFFNSEFEVTQYIDSRLAWNYRGQAEMTNGKEYTVTIRQKDDNLSITLDNNELVNHQFPENSLSGRIGLRAGAGASYPTEVAFDNVVVRSLDDSSELPLFKQTDTQWSEIEYDSAKSWSETKGTIGEYGCVISSSAMILHAHGITTLPSGELITPYSLNAWLLSQPDGYIGNGLVNFAAISRLSRILYQQNGTTKLEYNRYNSDALEKAQAELSQNKPVILQIPGHFFVGTQLLENDISIKDPAYSYTKLSEHSKPLLSTRTFTPSNTDLSYIVIAHDPSLSVNLTSLDGKITNPEPSQQDHINSAEQNGSSPTTSLLELAKPDSGTYSINIIGLPLTPYAVDLYTYSEDGDVTHFVASGITGSQPSTYALVYEKNTTSSLRQTTSWEEIDQELLALLQTGHISKYYAYKVLSSYLSGAQQLSPAQQTYLATEKLKLIQWFAWALSPEAQQLLAERFQALLSTQ
jgi:hypothetical protein